MLGLLACAKGDVSGYDVKKASDRSVGYFWAPARSQIYAVLPRLVKAGLATSRKVVQSGRPDKQVYRITRKGRKAVREWLETSDDSEDTFLLRVFYGDLMSKEALVALIERERELSKTRLTQFRAIERTGPDYHPHLTLRWGLAYRRATLRWADEVLRELE